MQGWIEEWGDGRIQDKMGADKIKVVRPSV
jgi:hypothetical protein